MTEHWHWGSNIPGYLPMADEPNIADTWDAARDGLLEDMEHEADAAYEEESGETLTMSEAIDAAMIEVRSWETGADIYVNPSSSRPHDLGLAYWVTACAEEECSTAEDVDREGGYVTMASMFVLVILIALASVLAGYARDTFGGMGAELDARATATSDTYGMEG